MKITPTMTALATTGLLGLAAVPVLAQDTTTTPEQGASESATGESTDPAAPDDDATPDDATAEEGDVGRAHDHGEFADTLAEELAAELGLDTDEVRDALDAVRERLQAERDTRMEDSRAEADAARAQALDDAVADGALTQDQADLLTDLFAARDGARDEVGRESLTDEQQAALEAFRAAAGEELGPMGGRGGHHGVGPGGRGPGHGQATGGDLEDAGDRESGDAADPESDDDATVQDSALLTT